MAIPRAPAAVNETSRHQDRRNPYSSFSVRSVIAAATLFFIAMAFHRVIVFFAVPVAGLLATVFGIVGAVTAHRYGNGRAEAWIGLLLGIGILVLAAAVGLYVWEASRSNWQF